MEAEPMQWDGIIAIGTVALAVMTGVLAIGTFWLGLQARGETRASREADIARQREVQVLATEPVILEEVLPGSTPAGLPMASFRLGIPTMKGPLLDVTVTVRGVTRDPGVNSISDGLGSLLAGSTADARIPLQEFLDLEKMVTWGPGLEVVVTYLGQLGQRLVEHYEWDWTAQKNDPAGPRLRLHRLEIVPDVVGARSVDHRFGGPALFE